MPSNYKSSYRAPSKPTAKALSRLRKELKENGDYTLTHIQKLVEEAYWITNYYNGLDKECYILLNKPENYVNLTEKTVDPLYEKVTDNLHTLLNEFPEYVEEQDRIQTRDSYLEDIKNLSGLHFPYEYSQYGGSDREYTRNRNITGWEAAIEGIFKKNLKRKSEWYQDLYTHLKSENKNYALDFDASEHISISMHVSSWSYWVTLKTTFKGEMIESGNCSYRDSEHNRL